MASLTASDSAIAKVTVAVKHRRRFCNVPGCSRIVKSQGCCQRHGAKPRECKVDGCCKQAQGNFDGMCKSHFNAMKRANNQDTMVTANAVPPEPEGFSVYDRIIPESITWNRNNKETMPLIKHLKQGFDAQKPPGWHRNEERLARGLAPALKLSKQLEGWERELAWTEILLLTGSPDASFRHLARGWGRDKGFHTILAQFICQRRGNLERKARVAVKRSKKEKVPTNNEVIAVEPAEPEAADVDNNELVGADLWEESMSESDSHYEDLVADLFMTNPIHEVSTAEKQVHEKRAVSWKHAGSAAPCAYVEVDNGGGGQEHQTLESNNADGQANDVDYATHGAMVDEADALLQTMPV